MRRSRLGARAPRSRWRRTMASSSASSVGSPEKSARVKTSASRDGRANKTHGPDLDQSVDARLSVANRRGEAIRNAGLARSVRYLTKLRQVRIELTTGAILLIPASRVQGLASASAADRRAVRIDGAGFSLHWPALDLDVSVPGLIAGLLGNKEWMSELARRAGRSRSPAKAKAARENGRKGGRPRKQQP